MSSSALAGKGLPNLGYRIIIAVGRKEFEVDVCITERVCRMGLSEASQSSDAEDSADDCSEFETCGFFLTD